MIYARRFITTECVLIPALLALAGCASFDPQPVVPADHAAQLQQRSLDDPALRAFVDANVEAASPDGPGRAWNLNRLTLAAFYFHPELDVARAQWAVAEAARVTAGERRGIGVSLAPGRNATTPTPSPRLVTSAVDLTLETGGKRGYRIAQATQLAESARLNVASIAWQVHSRVRSSLLGLYGAQESEKLLSQQQSLQTDNVRILEGQYRAGAISAFELTQARLAAASAPASRASASR